MRRSTQQRLMSASQLLLVGGLILAVGWNVAGLWQPALLAWWWLGLTLLLPGLLLWQGALLAPRLLANAMPVYGETYRLIYDAPEGWSDEAVRTALLNLVRSGIGLDILWAQEGAGTGCWLAVDSSGEVLERLVGDVFPAGRLEAGPSPAPGVGVTVLRWHSQLPSPAELCRLEGIEGVYYRWRDPATATVAIWGPDAGEVARQWAAPVDILIGQGEALRRPRFTSDNPWPNLPVFPSSQHNPGLAAVSRLEQLAPALRVTSPGLIVGHDVEGQLVGFGLPELAGMQSVYVVGQAAEQVAVSLTCQAVQAGLPTVFMDGRGTAAVQLSRRLLREIATGRALFCDVERPAQSRFRLNPLWLPGDEQSWPRILAGAWLGWLRELGVTPGGLGQVAYRHTLAAAVLTALTAAHHGLALEVRSLRDALVSPDFLTTLDEAALLGGVLEDETRTWWLAEGRRATTFDAHLRLGHLRERLSALLELPEYGVLWRGPYLDPLAVLNDGVSGLFWRLPDPRRRLRPYVTSQLLALTTLLTVWPAERPVVIVLHELEVGDWVRQLAAFAGARLLIASERVPTLVGLPAATALLASRLETPEDAEALQAQLPGVSATDLRRLPATCLVFRRGQDIGTLELLK